MAFDQQTRNELQRFVSNARSLLTEEFTRQLQNDYGLNPVSGEMLPLEDLGHLDNAQQETSRILRVAVEHYQASSPGSSVKDVLDRIVREQAFTVLNRLAALRMAEARGLLRESIAQGYQSEGFQLYSRVAGTALGETGEAYRCYLFSVFDEFAIDLRVLFDRFSPLGRLFPRETALLELLKLMNAPEIESLWAEDETIGWIYQYFNSKEERNKMRKESDAPRNSRELAVRNQFFTPRYVVEFLTDNTLGRIWYEMTQGKTSLKESCQYLVRRPSEIFLESGVAVPEESEVAEDLSQEALLGQPVYIPFRQLKDPRSMRMIDPACGSMHFGLYAFDLYERIYQEAWDLESSLGASRFQRDDGLKPLAESYVNQAAFSQDVPRLIIEHNIHGVDIDPRAVQIAGLSLWLRAQKSWQGQGLKAKQRPQIQKSNVICAEPMPGEVALLHEFLECHLSDTPEQRLVGQLVLRVFEAMKLAGEAGSLLKIEQEIAQDIEAARQQWLDGDQLLLLTVETDAPQQQELSLQVGDITDERFWERVEDEIYQALNRYAEQVEGGNSYQRRLFANDAARGFAFIDICRKRFDVVLMNPPFGTPSQKSLEYSREKYQDARDNLLIAFIIRNFSCLTTNGKLGSITDRSFVNKHAYRSFRKNFIIDKKTLNLFVDLGWNVLDDANVEVSIHTHSQNSRFSLFEDISKSEDKESKLLKSTSELSFIQHDISYFKEFPDSAFVYDLAEPLVKTYFKGDFIERKLFKSYGGLKAGDSERLFRLVWEVPIHRVSTQGDWSLFQNGSPFSPYYFGCHLVVKRDGNSWNSVLGNINSRIPNSELYFRAGICYGKRTDCMYGYKIRKNQVPSMEGHLVLPVREENIWYSILIINSSPYQEIVNHLCGQHKYASYINPMRLELSVFPDLSSEIRDIIRKLEVLDSGNETSISFTLPTCLAEFFDAHNLISSLEKTVKWRDSIVRETNIFRQSYNSTVEESIGWKPVKRPGQEFVDYVHILFSESNSIKLECSNLISYCLGGVFGRWDLRIINQSSFLFSSDDFGALPQCPPGMLIDMEGLPASATNIISAESLATKSFVDSLPLENSVGQPSVCEFQYALRIVWNGILVDDEGNSNDIIRHVRDVFKIIWGEQDSYIEQEVCEILKVCDLRDYFCKPTAFFSDHLTRYSNSRRQAPLYLPLSTRSGSYTLWLYYHRLTDQTLYTCINDYIEPKLLRTRDLAAQLRNKTDRTTSESKQLETLQDLESELTDLRDELLRIAKLPYQPNLNDGVQITVAPLWSLFRLPKWQKKLKETWETLEKGDYDWAHLAYSIWPDRIRQKCQTDKSLAIAHNLETLYEPPPEKPKKPSKTKRKTSTQPDLTP